MQLHVKPLKKEKIRNSQNKNESSVRAQPTSKFKQTHEPLDRFAAGQKILVNYITQVINRSKKVSQN